jgi:hypothetical protein
MHYLGIVLAAFAMFALGSVWFSPVMFVRAWVRESGVDASQKPDGKAMAKTFGLTLVLLLVSAAILSRFIDNWTEGEGILHGLEVGLMGGIWVTVATGINFLFEKKSLKLFLIDAGYHLVGFAVMGVILALV